MPTILVVGATGQQGGGVINALLAGGRTDVSIRALTRNTGSKAAEALARRGVTLCKGDLEDASSLAKALEGVDAAYLVTDFRGPGDVTGELKQGRQFVDAAKSAGVKHIVFSSVAGADVSEPVEHFYTKFSIEEYLRSSGMSWTVVRPVGFMEVIPPPGVGRAFFLGAMAALMASTRQKYVACDDIGKAVAKALLSPDQFGGNILTIAGQVADVDELQEALERGEGQKGWPRVWFPRWLVIRLTLHHYRQMFDWLYYENCQPGSVDETRALIPDVMDIETWAREQQARRQITH